MDDLHWVMIGLEICFVTNERPDLPDPCRLADHITDDDRREGIRRYFAEVEGTTDEDVENILTLYKQWEHQQEELRQTVDAFLFSMMPAAWAA